MLDPRAEAGVPLISVVMPVYNAEHYLRKAIQSILAQSFADFELLIVDDGSTDRSPTIAAELAARDPRIRIIHCPHAGVTAALNVGARQARGCYLARMDADDIAHPERFARQFGFLEAHPEVVAVGSAVTLIDAEGEVVAEQGWPTTHEEIDAWLMRGQSGLAHPATMLRVTAFRAIGGYREEFRAAQDFDLWLRLAEFGRLANLPEPLLFYRVTPASVSWVRYAEQQLCVRRALEEACNRRGMVFQLPAMLVSGNPRGSLESFLHLAFMAFISGHSATSRKYAWKAIHCHPWSWRSWLILMLASFVGIPFRRLARNYLARRPRP